MTEIRGSRTITLNLTQMHPGEGEDWLCGTPFMDWGDGIRILSARSPTLTHTYDTVGEYTLLTRGMNNCNSQCSHTDKVIVIESPTNVAAENITTEAVTITWDPVPGVSRYEWSLYDEWGGLLECMDVFDTYSVTIPLLPNENYTVGVTAIISTSEGNIYSDDYCSAINYVDFKTLTPVCNPPECTFTLVL